MLFSGMACFSPSVSPSHRKGWVKNGGTLTHTTKDFYNANFFFCTGLDDPWLSQLLSRSIVVRHANWVLKCIEEQFLMPVAPYTLDDQFKPSSIGVQDTKPTEPAPGLDYDHQTTYAEKRLMQNVEAITTLDIDTDTELQQNPLKRTISDSKADDSYPDIDPRIAKKPCVRIDFSPEASKPPLQAVHSQRRPIESSVPKSTACSASINQPQTNSQQPIFLNRRLDLRSTFRASHIEKLSKFKNKIFNPISKANATLPDDSTHNSQQDVTLVAPELNDSEGLVKFWDRTHKVHTSCGPLILRVNDIIQNETSIINGKIFTPGDVYHGEQFGLVWKVDDH